MTRLRTHNHRAKRARKGPPWWRAALNPMKARDWAAMRGHIPAAYRSVRVRDVVDVRIDFETCSAAPLLGSFDPHHMTLLYLDPRPHPITDEIVSVHTGDPAGPVTFDPSPWETTVNTFKGDALEPWPNPDNPGEYSAERYRK